MKKIFVLFAGMLLTGLLVPAQGQTKKNVDPNGAFAHR
jgi:hypothetical protein